MGINVVEKIDLGNAELITDEGIKKIPKDRIDEYNECYHALEKLDSFTKTSIREAWGNEGIFKDEHMNFEYAKDDWHFFPIAFAKIFMGYTGGYDETLTKDEKFDNLLNSLPDEEKEHFMQNVIPKLSIVVQMAYNMKKSRSIKELVRTQYEAYEFLETLDCLTKLVNSNKSFIYAKSPSMIFSATTNGVEIYKIHEGIVGNSIEDIFEEISDSDKKKIIYNLHLFR